MKYLQGVVRKLFTQSIHKRSGPVRYMFPVVIGALAILGASVVSSENKSYLELAPSTTSVKSGEGFYIDVYAFAHVPVNALDVTIEFIPETVQITGVDIGQSVLTVWTQEPKVDAGTITFGGGTYRRGFMGRHLIATIEAKALKTGKTEFVISGAEFLAGDGLGTPVALARDAPKTKQSFIIYDQDNDPAAISASVGLYITPDIDGDGMVTLRDISSFMTVWYNKEKTYDFNDDARMNFIDFSIILAKSVSS